MLSLGGMGPWFRGGMDKQRPVADEEAFLRLKGEVEQLACMLRAGDLLTFESSQDGTFAPGQSARILLGALPLGRIGLLHPRWRQAHKLSGPIALAEVNLDRLVSQKPALRVMRAIPAYPAVSRDIALILPRSRTHAMVMAQVNQSRPSELEDVRLFDVYRGDKLGAGEQSLAYRFTYRSAKQTLTDEAVEGMHQPMLDRLLRELDARIEGR